MTLSALKDRASPASGHGRMRDGNVCHSEAACIVSVLGTRKMALVQAVSMVSPEYPPEAGGTSMGRSDLALESAEAVSFNRSTMDVMRGLDPELVEIVVDVQMKTGDNFSLRAVTADGTTISPVADSPNGSGRTARKTSARLTEEIAKMALSRGFGIECRTGGDGVPVCRAEDPSEASRSAPNL